MALLSSGGIGRSLKDANINVFGYVEGSYIYNFAGADKDNFGNVFEPRSNQFLGNQLDLAIERGVDASKKEWDLGGRVEVIYGADARFIHSNGLNWYAGADNPEYQVDLNQAYMDLAVPVGNGLRIRAGKYNALTGYETIAPSTNMLFTHSYLFYAAGPYTHTGIMGTYQLNENWLVEGGIFRGWDQSADDNNGSISYHVKLGYTSTDKKLSTAGQVLFGPETADDTSDYTTLFDLTLTYALTERLTLGVNADIGYGSNCAVDGDTAWWYGIACYAGYGLNDTFALNGRGEWFRDDGGARLGVDASYFEGTVGMGITPWAKDRVMKNLVIRPEFRADFSTEDVFNKGRDDQMYTFAVDMVFKF